MVYNRIKLTIYFLIVSIIFILITINNVNAIALTPINEQEILLDERYNSLLDSTLINTCIENNNISCTKSALKVKYIYISDTFIPKEPTEILEKRTYNTIAYNDGTYKIYSGQPFIKVGNTWYQTEFDYVEPEIFDQVVADQLIGLRNIFKNNNPLKIYKAHAETYTYYGSNDDSIYNTNPVWATAHDAVTGTLGWIADEGFSGAWNESGSYSVRRHFVEFDISGLATSTYNNIATGSIFMWVTNTGTTKTLDRDYTFTGSSASNPLVAGDFDLCDTNLKTDVIDESLISNPQYNEWTLDDATTLTHGINQFCLRENNYDVLDSAPPAGSGSYDQISVQLSSYTGTDHDPYLYLGIAVEEATSSTSTTEILYGTECTPEDINDIGFITGCSYVSSTTNATYYNFHASIIKIAFILIIFFLLFHRIMIEFLIRWRR